MKTRKMFERIKWYKKDYVHNQYARIVDNFKDYEKITVVKMLEAVYKVYEDYKNIINICTVRELKYLKMILDKKVSMEELSSEKYDWEKKELHDKFLIQWDYSERIFIPDEIIDNVKIALKNVNWDIAKKLDQLNEVLVGFCKIQASILLDSLCSFAYSVTNVSKDNILTHILFNRVFKYYVMVYEKDIEGFKKGVLVALHQDYYSIEDEIDEERKKQGLVGDLKINLQMYKTLFYNDFDINNKKISKFLEELEKLPVIRYSIVEAVKEYAVLNKDRESLKKAISQMHFLKNYDLTEFFKVLDEAMDEMPSGVLNGFTPNEAKKVKLEKTMKKIEKERNYVKQYNACLSRSDANLFYKIYFGLLEFTNNKYKIKPNLKIYNKKGINPNEIVDIIDVYWKNKDEITNEFCLANPYKFNDEELKIIDEFKNGFRDMFIIAKFYEEYTTFMNMEKTYMVKGVNDNLDNVVSYKDLPITVITSIIPFKNLLIYDGILTQFEIEMGNAFEEMITKDLESSIKYYHL